MPASIWVPSILFRPLVEIAMSKIDIAISTRFTSSVGTIQKSDGVFLQEIVGINNKARQELDAWRSSGLSMAEYCRTRGLHENRLYGWRVRLGESNSQIHKSKRSISGSASSHDETKLRLVEATITTTSAGEKIGPALRLCLGDVAHIEVIEPGRLETRWLVELSRGLMEHVVR